MHAKLGAVRFRSQRKGALTDEQPERQPADPLHARRGLQGSHALRDRANRTVAESHVRRDKTAKPDGAVDLHDLGIPAGVAISIGQDGPHRFEWRIDERCAEILFHVLIASRFSQSVMTCSQSPWDDEAHKSPVLDHSGAESGSRGPTAAPERRESTALSFATRRWWPRCRRTSGIARGARGP